jgi:NADH dehydrogenase FAD-containing subunit
MGGVAAAAHLCRLLAGEHSVLLVERKATFSLCMANLWLMAGERLDPRQGERPLADLSSRGIEVVQGEVEVIDPTARTVRTSAGVLGADYSS